MSDSDGSIKKKRLQKVMQRVEEKPLKFVDGFAAESIRALNRGQTWQ